MRNEQFWQWFDSYAAPRLVENPGMARANTFRQMFEYLDSLDRAVHIVETGCVEDPDNWGGNGCSTLLFNKYTEMNRGSTVVSIEIDPDKVVRARDLCHHTLFYVNDSVKQLQKFSTSLPYQIDLLYLDASDHNWMAEAPTQVHHYNELLAAMPMLSDHSLVAVDDSLIALDDYPQNKIIGKGGLVAQYAFEVGAELKFCEYQVGFTKITNKSPTMIEHIDDLVNRARELNQGGCTIAADRLYRLVIHVTAPPWTGRARAARGEALAHFARNAYLARRHGLAIDWFWRAFEADPLWIDYRCEMARCMVAIGAMAPAQRQASIATDIEPDNPIAWQTLGGVESDLMNENATIEAYDMQIKTATNDLECSDALLNRATIALDTRDYDLVRKLCEDIIYLDVRKGDAYHMLAMLEYRLSNHELSIEWFDKALSNGCRNQPLTHWNKALPLESIGRFKEGRAEAAWAEKEMTQHALYISQHRFNKPKWRGEPAPATIHVHTEAGAGDNISMFRYFPLLLERGYKVHYEADPSMLSFAQRNFPDVVCMPRTKDYPGVIGTKPFDYHIPIGDLHHAFGIDLDTIPPMPLLKANPELSEQFANKLGKHKRRKIGLCWSSGIRTTVNIWMAKYGRMKSMTFRNVIPIVSQVGILRIVPLQVGDGRDENDLCIDHLSRSPDWDETAALIDNLDLVITVDTGVAHMAGAMGKPTWVMMQRDGASWHFMCWRPGASWNEASPWYPSIRVFRQHEFNQPGYWTDVVNDVVKALQEPMQQAAE